MIISDYITHDSKLQASFQACLKKIGCPKCHAPQQGLRKVPSDQLYCKGCAADQPYETFQALNPQKYSLKQVYRRLVSKTQAEAKKTTQPRLIYESLQPVVREVDLLIQQLERYKNSLQRSVRLKLDLQNCRLLDLHLNQLMTDSFFLKERLVIGEIDFGTFYRGEEQVLSSIKSAGVRLHLQGLDQVKSFSQCQKDNILIMKKAFKQAAQSSLASLQQLLNVHRKDDKDGCYFGELGQGQVKEGMGVMIWADGEKYQGGWVANSQQGKGMVKYPNGDFCFGEFKQGSLNGIGRYFYSSGDIYEGNFKNDVKYGTGRYRFANGQSYAGVWVDGQLADDEPSTIEAAQGEKVLDSTTVSMFQSRASISQ